MKLEPADLQKRAARIRLLLMDCDGVLTDGRVWLMNDGDEHKAFNVHDGQGIALLHRAGLKTGLISGRSSSAIERRGHELQIDYVRQSVSEKLKTFDEVLSDAGVSTSECAYVGDDLADISIMRRVGLAIAVANAVDETRNAAHYITSLDSGKGAVREVCELILKAQGRWDELIRKYLE